MNLGSFIDIHEVVAQIELLFGELNGIRNSINGHHSVKGQTLYEIEHLHGEGTVQYHSIPEDFIILQKISWVLLDQNDGLLTIDRAIVSYDILEDPASRIPIAEGLRENKQCG